MDEVAGKQLGGNIGAELGRDQLPIPRIGEDGKPVYDQEFFVSLARRKGLEPMASGQPSRQGPALYRG